MKELVYNYENISDNDIDKIIIRVKAIIINEKNEILLGREDITYQVPGGHLEENETMEQCLIREISEETGIVIDSVMSKPFFKISYYTKNIKYEIYYYNINIDNNTKIYNTKLTIDEKTNNYRIEFIPINKVVSFLESTISNISDKNDIIVRDMIIVLNEYLKNK